MPPSKQTTLQRILTTTVNELVGDALVAIQSQENGPLVSQVSRGFTEREVRAVLRALSSGDWLNSKVSTSGNANDPKGALRFRLVTPGSKSLLAVPLKDGNQPYGALVLGKKERSVFGKRERSSIETVNKTITDQLREAQLFDPSIILGRPKVSGEPLPLPVQDVATRSFASGAIQERLSAILKDGQGQVPFDRAWVTLYDPLAASLEILASVAGHKKELLPGQHVSFNDSASGWVVRHRKARIDQNLASTQGRFQDYKQLYRDRFRCTVIVPFFIQGRVAGTVTLASKTAGQYESAETGMRQLDPATTQIVALFEDPKNNLSLFSVPEVPGQPKTGEAEPKPHEPIVRREERQAALTEVSSFLTKEIREPMGSIRAQLEDITGEGTLEFEAQTRVEAAMRDLIRMESLLHDVLDFAKPLELDRQLCRVSVFFDEVLALVMTDLKASRIEVTKTIPVRLPQVRWDRDKMQHVFLSILKNALDAMSPGGHLQITVSQTRGRQPEMVIRVHNDGVSIPEDLVEKVFEPYFTTKCSGTGLGLAMVKKIVEEHQGHIAIESHSEKGTTVTLKVPALRPRVPYRQRSPGRRPSKSSS
ncbi:MAG: ATP-binding protein [Nitrospirota bacterium]|nr:ATP-binding protein [Nitrospirota bacterium]